MKYSKLFGKTTKQSKTYDTLNATLLTKAGFVNQLMAGAYTMLPLGLRVLKKIEDIIRDEMNQIGGQEILMPALHPSRNWKKTGGWDAIDVLFKIKSRTGKEYALGQSEEEVVTPLSKEYTFSYKELPIALYQIQNKFRDELRAKSGILRGREFGMKDMYSFHTSHKDFLEFYSTVKDSYLKIYKRSGLKAKATEASGGSFSKKISYEFMVLTDAGEDDILYCSNCNYCINKEISKGINKCQMCGSKLKSGKASEVGNVFDLGQKYSKDFKFSFTDKDGKEKYPFMGCYGIGTTRLMGVIVEKSNDKNGIIWPISVAPFQVHLISLGDSKNINSKASDLYQAIKEAGIEILWDDRSDVSAGVKFNDADLIGIPIRLVMSKKSLSKDGIELKLRNSKEVNIYEIDKITEVITQNIKTLKSSIKS